MRCEVNEVKEREGRRSVSDKSTTCVTCPTIGLMVFGRSCLTTSVSPSSFAQVQSSLWLGPLAILRYMG